MNDKIKSLIQTKLATFESFPGISTCDGFTKEEWQRIHDSLGSKAVDQTELEANKQNGVAGGLSFNALRAANSERVASSKYSKCEENWTAAHWMQATVGELGELANLLKKVDRGDFPFEQVKDDVARELADVQCYLDILALKLDIDLGKATVSKFNEVSERIGSNVKLPE